MRYSFIILLIQMIVVKWRQVGYLSRSILKTLLMIKVMLSGIINIPLRF